MRDFAWAAAAITTGVFWLGALFWLAQRLEPLFAYGIAVAPLILCTTAVLVREQHRRRSERRRLLDEEFR